MKWENLYLTIINNLNDGIYFVDNDRRITFWNKAAEEITGYKKEEIAGKQCQHNILNHIDEQGRPLCIMGCPLYSTIVDGTQRKAKVYLRHKDGHRIPITVNIFPIQEDGKTVGAVEVFTRSTPTVYDDNLIEQLSSIAMHDSLTGIANRVKMESYLEYRLNELKKFGRKFCVVFLDLDNFSNFNNTYGHEMGDKVLIGVAKSVSHNVRTSDMFGRWGGEEFLGVFEIKKDEDALIVAEKVRMLIAGTELSYEDKNLSVTASIGVTVARDGDDTQTVVERADSLMYFSKKKKNCVSSDADLEKL